MLTRWLYMWGGRKTENYIFQPEFCAERKSMDFGRIRMIYYTREVVKEVLAALALFGAAGVVLILAVFRGEALVPCLLGFLLGVILAAGLFLHMSVTLETTVDMRNEKQSKNRGTAMYVIRMSVTFLVFYLAWRSGKFNLIAVFCGVLGLKAAVYLQPFIHTVCQHRGKRNQRNAD